VPCQTPQILESSKLIILAWLSVSAKLCFDLLVECACVHSLQQMRDVEDSFIYLLKTERPEGH